MLVYVILTTMAQISLGWMITLYKGIVVWLLPGGQVMRLILDYGSRLHVSLHESTLWEEEC